MRFFILIIISGLLINYTTASESIQLQINKKYIILKANPKIANTRVPAPIIINNNRESLATFNVTYNGFSTQAQTAFQYAVDIWASLISSPVQIKVVANWDSLGTNILGSASAGTFLRFSNNTLPQPNTWYPIALAESYLSSSYNHPDSADIVANFNSNFSQWYFGIDGNCPAGRYDFVSVVLHELCHGLGFIGSMNVSGSQGSWGFGSGYPFAFDHQAENGSGQSLLNTTLFPNPSTTLADQLRSNNIFFNGVNTNIANGGLPVKLYAPAIWDPGSSFSHLNESTFPPGNPNSLMTPSLSSAEAIHHPGDITLRIFEDIGWTLDPALGIEENNEINLVTDYKLHQNFPNPFNPETHIKYDILKNSKVKIEIYNLSGKLISTLIDEYKSPGSYQVSYKPTNLASGVYLYRIQAEEYSEYHKMLFVK